MDAILTHNLYGHPSGRLTRIYNTQEHGAINVFKNQYLEATSPAARKTIAQVHILPALFNYWISVGQVVDNREIKVRTVELINWLRNVWRAPRKMRLAQGSQYCLMDVLWWTRQAQVLGKIALIMDLQEVDMNTPGWFQH
ncbi:hypothetical protein BYT27DRAFT_7262369 [Phlegmacium glaucopus]|nr:hypothetical protein BYT27DRAFT_7262369 [Phlegmacium glaucopus]